MTIERPPTRDWKRGLPPFFLATVFIVLLALLMPNALRLPQQNPTPVLEYAPVPPDDNSSPNTGNLGSLGLGQSPSLSEGSLPPPLPGGGKSPPGKHCVGKPPRQTEDPMSPPCVPFFTGDNGGATWQGVTKDEVTVVAYHDVGNYNNESSPGGGTFIDVDKPPLSPCPKGTGDGDPNTCDHQITRQTRALSIFFNNRFQTYNRHVHFWIYFARGGTPAGRRNDAIAIYDRLRPFAVLDQATFQGNNEAFEDALAARKVLVFTSETTLALRFFTKYPGFVWGFWPDTEHWAEMYSSYVCTKVKPFKVSRMGNPPGSDVQHVGKDRKYGLFYTADTGEPGLKRFRELVIPKLRACGVTWDSENVGTYPKNRFVTDNSDPGGNQAQTVQKFKVNGVTTVLWLGGVEGRFSQYAEGAKYYPEIVLAGDLNQDNNVTAREQAQTVWQNAWITHFNVRFDANEATPGFRAYRASYPGAPEDEARYVNDFYRDHFMLFTAIQVAGPRVTPERVDQGFHAIPPKASKDPYVASCYFDPVDYSCVKDSTEMWWDPGGISPGDGRPGCWRMVLGGRRARAHEWWPDETVFKNGRNDPCTGYDGGRRLRLA